ncbi:MAG: hypothetical protein KA791_13705 [Flavobacteriales bacterium]|nr:hypothetical protein [Flavobacteriales bacterium]
MSLSLSEDLIYAAGMTSKNTNIFTFFPLFDPGTPAWYDEVFNSPNLSDGFTTAFCVEQHAVAVEEHGSTGLAVFDDQQGFLVFVGLSAGRHRIELFDALGRSVFRSHAAGGDRAMLRHPLVSIAAGVYMVVVDGARVGKILHGR